MKNGEQIELLLPKWLENSRQQAEKGQVADYIPELAKAPKGALGILLMDKSGTTLQAGDAEQPFTMQSISKVFTLLLALIDNGEEHVFSKVGMEPTGDDFNSMLKLELVEPGKPFNPLINAGAIAITALIKGNSPQEKTERIVSFFSALTGDSRLGFNAAVAASEAATAHRNRSLAYFLLDNQVLPADADIEGILDVYFKHCAIEVTCRHIARLGLLLACKGQDPLTGRQLIPARYAQIAKTFMFTCGMYNASGEFAIRAGIPAKSGVAGGIMAVVPGEYGIGVYAPALNSKGNSIAGVHLLETMSAELKWSLF